LERRAAIVEFSAVPTEEFLDLLARRRITLGAQIAAKLDEAKAERIGPDASASTDGGDRGSLDLSSEIDLAIAGRDIEELRDIEAAQERLAEGTFGSCADCDAAIVLARLRAYPTARRCTSCQANEERAHGLAQPARL
jgi:RNA polymerase-binding transcription factor DksA